MNISDLVSATIKDNEVDRICDNCLCPEYNHVQSRDGAGCTVTGCGCDGYLFNRRGKQ